MIVGDPIEGRKLIPVKKMKELLNELPDTHYLCAQTIANTGDIAVYSHPKDLMCCSVINMRNEIIITFPNDLL